MKSLLLVLFIACSAIISPTATAALADVEIKVVRQKLDQGVSRRDGDTRVVTKEIIYNVTIQSKTFKTLENLEVRYMVFYYDSEFGSRERPTEHSRSGSEKIAVLQGNKSVDFQTKSITLTSESLDGNVIWANGASSTSKDRVSGVWVRAFNSAGAVIGEYASPSSITKRDWKD